MLADLGADVIKVDRPGRGDDARSYGPPFLKDLEGNQTDESTMYVAANRNKRSITINYASQQGQEVIKALAANADVLVENYKVGDLARYGLDYESLKKINPRLIYLSVTGFGQTGPSRAAAAYDPIFQARGGLMGVTGIPDGMPGGGPMKVGPSIADIVGGLYGVIGVLAALNARREAGGSGQHIDLSLLDCLVSTLGQQAQHYFMTGENPPRRGAEGNGAVPSCSFRCADGDVYLMAGNDAQYDKLCEALRRPDLKVDPRFVSNAGRVAHRRELLRILDDEIGTWNKADVLEALGSVGIPVAPINSISDVFADAQVVARGLQVRIPHPRAGEISVVANPINMSGTPVKRYSAPPATGEHTDAILAEVLGYGPAQIENLHRVGAI